MIRTGAHIGESRTNGKDEGEEEEDDGNDDDADHDDHHGRW